MRTVERRVDDGKARDHPRVFEIAQPLAVVVGQLLARPVDGFGRGRIEAVQVFLRGTVFIVIALDDGDGHRADDVETFLGIGVVADHVAEARVMGDLLLLAVLQNDAKGLQVGVDVGYDGKLHLLLIAQFRIRESRCAPRSNARLHAGCSPPGRRRELIR